MKWIKKYELFRESKSFQPNKNIITEICVSMILLNNEWLVNPEKTEPNIDDRIIIEKGSEYGDKIDKLIQSASKGVDVLNKIDELRKKLKKFRQSGLDSGGEYSYENLTFKLLRRNGYIEKLLKLKTDITDKKLSITQ